MNERQRKKQARRARDDAAYRKALGVGHGEQIPKQIGYAGRTGDLSRYVRRPRGTGPRGIS